MKGTEILYKIQKSLLTNKWISVLGFLGFLGFLPKQNGDANYFFFILFSFFSWYWWAKIEKEDIDERLEINIKKSKSYLSGASILLSFFILFFLDKGIDTEILLALGSIGYSLIFILTPIVICYLDGKE